MRGTVSPFRITFESHLKISESIYFPYICVRFSKNPIFRFMRIVCQKCLIPKTRISSIIKSSILTSEKIWVQCVSYILNILRSTYENKSPHKSSAFHDSRGLYNSASVHRVYREKKQNSGGSNKRIRRRQSRCNEHICRLVKSAVRRD